jgi:hypothetical protein
MLGIELALVKVTLNLNTNQGETMVQYTVKVVASYTASNLGESFRTYQEALDYIRGYSREDQINFGLHIAKETQ